MKIIIYIYTYIVQNRNEKYFINTMNYVLKLTEILEKKLFCDGKEGFQTLFSKNQLFLKTWKE